jgi:Fe-S cluster biogenesis protein NfuA
MPLARAVARRIRAGVNRRVDRVLQKVGWREPTPVADPVPVPAAAPVPAAPVLAAPAPAPVVEAPVAEEPQPDSAGLPLLTREQIETLFEDMVRPALQSDGGDIRLVKVEDNDVYVELVGACQTCPSSIVTMQMGIERLLQEEFPQFGRLIRVNEQV